MLDSAPGCHIKVASDWPLRRLEPNEATPVYYLWGVRASTPDYNYDNDGGLAEDGKIRESVSADGFPKSTINAELRRQESNLRHDG